MPDSVVMVLEAACARLLLGCELNFHQQADAFVDMHAASGMASSAYSERSFGVVCRLVRTCSGSTGTAHLATTARAGTPSQGGAAGRHPQ